MYYNVKVKLSIENGDAIKKTTEVYLVDAVSVTDAEVKVTEDFKGYGGDWSLESVAKSNIIKVF